MTEVVWPLSSGETGILAVVPRVEQLGSSEKPAVAVDNMGVRC